MTDNKIINAMPPHLDAKIAKMAKSRKLSVAETIVLCLKGETTQTGCFFSPER